MSKVPRRWSTAGSPLRMYSDLAKIYDAQYSWKDYASEVRRLEKIARRFGRSGRSTWLDVACGTGRHLELLRRHFECEGVDASPEMLRVARRRLSGIPLSRADMRSFRLGREFGVVSCLFSAIGHLSSERDLVRTFERIAEHLAPGGVAIVEPWVSPDDFHPGLVHLRTYQDPSITVVRMAYSGRRRNRSIIRYSYLIGAQGKGIRFVEDTDTGLMVQPARLRHLMESAGLQCRFLRHGFMARRGLLIGVKPTTRPPRRSPGPRTTARAGKLP